MRTYDVPITSDDVARLAVEWRTKQVAWQRCEIDDIARTMAAYREVDEEFTSLLDALIDAATP